MKKTMIPSSTPESAENPSSQKRIVKTAYWITLLGAVGAVGLVVHSYYEEAQRLNAIAGHVRATLVRVSPNVFAVFSEELREDIRVLIMYDAEDQRYARVVFYDSDNKNNILDAGENRSEGKWIEGDTPNIEDILSEVGNPQSPLNRSAIKGIWDGIKKDTQLIFEK